MLGIAFLVQQSSRNWDYIIQTVYFDVFIHAIDQTYFFSGFHERGRFSEW